jgi:hypothetical protein
MFDKMLEFLRIKKKPKSTTDFPGYYSDAPSLHSPFQHPNFKGKLVLPTSLDEVAAAAHRSTPKQLPGEDASEDDVRYFLYEILTHKDHGIVRLNPQWILETCMSWHGGGHLLRSLPFDSYQQLCPLYRGHAAIDRTVKCSKFSLQDMPPCGTRDRIAAAVRTAVATLKSSETGHRSSGWQISKDVRRSATSRSTERRTARNPTSPTHPDLHVPSFAAASPHPTREQYYTPSNQSAPQLNSPPSLDIYQDPFFTLHGSAFVLPQSVGRLSEQLGPANDLLPFRDDKECRLNSPPSSPPPAPLPSPALSYVYSDRSVSQTSDFTQLTMSIRDSASTATTSPPSSENDISCWLSKAGRPRSMSQSTGCSISRSSTDEQFIPSEAYQVIPPRASVGTPSRYRMKPNPRSFDPQLHMAHLRNLSYNTTAVSRFSSLTPSYEATDQHGYRRDSTISPKARHDPLHHEPALRPFIRPTSSYATMPHSCPTPPQRLPTPTTMATATPISRSRTSSVRPSHNYVLDDHAFDTAKHIDHKSGFPLPHSMMVDQGERLRRGKSDNSLYMRVSNHGNRAYGQDTVGPPIRSRDPQTGMPRLTMVETIEQHQRLGKQRLEGQRRMAQLQQPLKTVYETIEEQEIINGRPQRGLDNVQHGWASYY